MDGQTDKAYKYIYKYIINIIILLVRLVTDKDGQTDKVATFCTLIFYTVSVRRLSADGQEKIVINQYVSVCPFVRLYQERDQILPLFEPILIFSYIFKTSLAL